MEQKEQQTNSLGTCQLWEVEPFWGGSSLFFFFILYFIKNNQFMKSITNSPFRARPCAEGKTEGRTGSPVVDSHVSKPGKI
jgi:hypothetical protein